MDDKKIEQKNYHVQLAATPTQGTRGDAIGNPSEELTVNRRIIGRIGESKNKMDDLRGDRFIVEGRKGVDERGDKEVRVKGEDGLKEKVLRESSGELRESVGDMDSRRERIADEI